MILPKHSAFRICFMVLMLSSLLACGSSNNSNHDAPPAAPTIILQPTDQTATDGQNVTFTVAASGNPMPTYQWERSPDGTTWVAIGSATGASYSFTTQTSDNGAKFRGNAINSAGTATSNAALLTVNAATAPIISLQPTGQTVSSGQDVTYTIAATGNPAPTYQWERSSDGTTWVAISGATSASYSFTAQPADNGAKFRGKAINIAGTATSNVASLTVTPLISTNNSWTVFKTVVSPSSLPTNGNLVANGSLDAYNGSAFTGWSAYPPGGYQVDSSTHHSSGASAKVVAASTTEAHGLYQTIAIKQTSPSPIVFSAWSKAANISGVADSGYSIFFDINYTDGTSMSAINVAFPVGTQDWNQASGSIFPLKPIDTISVYLLLRNSHTGTAWFDDVSVGEFTGQVYSFEKNLLINNSAAFPYTGSTPLSIATADGLSLSASSEGGAITSLQGAAGAMANAGSIFASGFFFRDVAIGSDYIHPSTTVTQPSPGTLQFNAFSPDLNLYLFSTFTAQSNYISVEGNLASNGGNRAVTLYFALPIDATNWTWGDDIRNDVVLSGNQEHANPVSVPFGATGNMSLYPLASIHNATDGISLAYPLDAPAQVRFMVNTSTKQLVMAYDVGLSDLTKIPGTASFSFIIYRHDPTWGFREALTKYTSIFPNLFTKRVTKEGIWIAGTDLSTIPPPLSDFHIAFHEMIDNRNMPFDNSAGVKALRYQRSPSSYWLTLPTGSATDYNTMLSALQSGLHSSNTSIHNGAESTLSSGMIDASGQLVVDFETSASDPNSAVFTVDPDPDIADPTYPLNKAHYQWNDAIKALYTQNVSLGILDGEYIDSLEFSSTAIDHRNLHLAASDLPLTFDASFNPVVPEIWASYEYVRWVGSDVHNLNKLMMANGSLINFGFYAPVFDILGIETSWIINGSYLAPQDSWFNFKRSMSYQKPYCLLMNTDFTLLTNPLVERYFQTSLFYGMYPSMFSADGYTSVYWATPTLVNRDRALFIKYIPLIQTLGSAGWEPTTYARSSVASVAVERYGSGSSLYLTLRNLSTSSQTTTITMQADALGLSTTHPTSVVDLISGSALPLTSNGNSLIFQDMLTPDSVRMYQPQ